MLRDYFARREEPFSGIKAATAPTSQPSSPSRSFQWMRRALAKAQIAVDGPHPWDMQVHNPKMVERILAFGSVGLGESYMDGDWDVAQLDEFFFRILHHRLDDEINPWNLVLHRLRNRLLNLQNLRRVWQVGQVHYDLGNDFYSAMLDRRMTYSCGYWKSADTLDEAQEAKLDLICRKLELKPGMRVLDIGCGWGSFMQYAAQHYGVDCVGLTISREQAAEGRNRCKGLPVDIRLQDYRDMDEKFDRAVSIGMFEHVGQKNYRTYMRTAARCLNEGGLFLLHTIGKNLRNTVPDPWIDKYIFPNGSLPALGEISDAVEKLFIVEDVHNFGPDYEQTLLAWHRNFEACWPRFRDRYGDRFYRMWRYYLLSCAGAFRARDLQLWQFVLSKGGRIGGYRRPVELKIEN